MSYKEILNRTTGKIRSQFLPAGAPGSYVPYDNADADVDLGAFDLSAQNVITGSIVQPTGSNQINLTSSDATPVDFRVNNQRVPYTANYYFSVPANQAAGSNIAPSAFPSGAPVPTVPTIADIIGMQVLRVEGGGDPTANNLTLVPGLVIARWSVANQRVEITTTAQIANPQYFVACLFFEIANS
jgi:hypothetical protein